jgi:RNA polymerase sigma factor (sigma-70 family)
MTDQELVQRCLSGNREAQKQLFKTYAGSMMSVCLRYCDSREEAEDVLQDGFIRVFEKLSQWNNSGPLGGWIRMIMINTSLNYLRVANKWRDKIDIEAAEELRSDSANALQQMSANDLMALIQTMPLGYRTVFNLFAIEGYGHKEIADLLGISENTSKTQFLKAKLWLQKALEKESRSHEG